jgi:three-Cys-motif partner protein
MQIVLEYAQAYLQIMANQEWASTIYFDGFAGSGYIENDTNSGLVEGTALRILDIVEPVPFDIYYFVELSEENKSNLELIINDKFPNRRTYVVKDDCNKKLIDMATFMKKNTSYRALAFIDPYGMSLNWESLMSLKGAGVDLWILVPTGLGVNRMLKKDGNISDSWYSKLEQFLGLSKEQINEMFYKKQIVNTLFGEHEFIEKEKNSVIKIGDIYKSRLNEIFKYVSESFVLRNKTNSIMYHFMMATNNTTALKISNDIIKPKYKI